MTLPDLIDSIGVRRVARHLNVSPGTVHNWKVQGMAWRGGQYGRAKQRYLEGIAELSGMTVDEVAALSATQNPSPSVRPATQPP